MLGRLSCGPGRTRQFFLVSRSAALSSGLRVPFLWSGFDPPRLVPGSEPSLTLTSGAVVSDYTDNDILGYPHGQEDILAIFDFFLVASSVSCWYP